MTKEPLIRNAVDADGDSIARLIASVFDEYDGCPFVSDDFPELAAPASHYERRSGRLLVAGHRRPRYGQQAAGQGKCGEAVGRGHAVSTGSRLPFGITGEDTTDTCTAAA